MARTITREHKARMQRILDLMTVEARPFADDSDEAKAARKALPFDAWCHTYLPHYFSCASAPMHHEADAAVEEKGMPIGVEWGRMMGKSVRYAMAWPLHKLLSHQAWFEIQLALTEDRAIDRLDLMRLELENNARLRADYGEEISPKLGSAEANDWIAAGVRVLARGNGQSCRGLLHGPHRPDLIVGDDLEDEELTRNPKRIKHLLDFIFGNAYGATEKAGTDAWLVLLLNTYGRHSIAAHMAEKAREADKNGRPVMKHFVYGWEDEKGESVWPERMNTEALRRAESVMGPRLYRRNMLCIADDDEAVFRADWIRSFKAVDVVRTMVNVVLALDPSAKAKETNDFKSLVVLARPIGTRETHCLHAWIRRASVMEMLNEIFRSYDRFKPGRSGCEEVGFMTLIWPLLDAHEELRQRAEHIHLIPLQNTTSKEDRILALQPDFEQGLCYFDSTEGDQRILIGQFLDFGKPSVHDDGPDSYEMGRRLLPIPERKGRNDSVYQRGDSRTNYEAMV